MKRGLAVSHQKCSESKSETHSGDPNLNPKNSNKVSKLVILIKSALLLSIAPRISYPPVPKQ